MTMPFKLTLALVVVLAATCAVTTYLWIDRSISLAYARQSADATQGSLRVLKDMLEREWRGMPEAQLLKKLEEVPQQLTDARVVVKREGESFLVNDIRFQIKQGQLHSIEH